jgi:hypothetical protein
MVKGFFVCPKPNIFFNPDNLLKINKFRILLTIGRGFGSVDAINHQDRSDHAGVTDRPGFINPRGGTEP